MLDLTPLAETPVGVEADRIEKGEAWTAIHIAGLQFYDYGADDGLEGRVRPIVGDRLNLVRAPENPHDANAIEVWWRNEYRLGHVPRPVARMVAPQIDDGRPLRAYVWDGGDGAPWSMDMLLVGPAVGELHGQWLEREADHAEYELRGEVRRRARARRNGLVHGNVIGTEQSARRRDRLAQAVAVFSRLPWEPELPPIGSEMTAERLGELIGCSGSTIHGLAKRVGLTKRIVKHGYYSYAQPYEMTSAFRRAIVEWCRKPRAIARNRIEISDRRAA